MTHHDPQHATFRGILDEAIERGAVSRKEIGVAVGAEDEMVRRWLCGQMPKLKYFLRLIKSPSMPLPLRRAILDWALRNSGFKAIHSEDEGRTVLDANADGIVDAKDTLTWNIHAASEGTKAMEAMIRSLRDGKLNEAEKAQVRALCYDAMAALEKAIASLDCGMRIRCGA